MSVSVRPFLWFEKDAQKAAKFYVSVFKKGSKVLESSPAMTRFRIMGREYIAFNGGPHFRLNESFSLFIACKTQAEVDYYWKKLAVRGKRQTCGWLEDKYGLWWQVIPDILPKLLYDRDKEKAGRAMQAMMKMKKIDIAALKKAHAGK